MILQYRLPFDVPELGAHAGDVVVIDTRYRTVDVSREVPASEALPLLAQLIPTLEPVATHLSPRAAVALVAALAPHPGGPGRLRLA